MPQFKIFFTALCVCALAAPAGAESPSAVPKSSKIPAQGAGSKDTKSGGQQGASIQSTTGDKSTSSGTGSAMGSGSGTGTADDTSTMGGASSDQNPNEKVQNQKRKKKKSQPTTPGGS